MSLFSSSRSASFLVASVFLILIAFTEAFVRMPTDYSAAPRHHRHQHSFAGRLVHASVTALSAGNEEDIPDGPEKSQMYNFISNYLSKENGAKEEQSDADDDVSTADDDLSYTHLIALPVDACHELLLELESVQRAVLYNCPVLVHACITQAITRLPLLYVQTDADASFRASGVLRDMVQDAVKKHIYSTAESKGKDDAKDDVEAEAEPIEVEIKRDDGMPDLSGENDDGIKPLMMAFKGLEIDGARNEVLHTVADVTDECAIKLQEMVGELQERIHKETGWKTALPNDDKAGKGEFRPRIPFMRLPPNWDKFLEAGMKDAEEGEESQDIMLLKSDQGGNGISPILWCQWDEDVYGTARMREVAVYKRRKGYAGLDEQAFYMPEQTVRLPDGNAALAKEEARHQQYQEQRMAEAENLENEESRKKSSQKSEPVSDDGLVSDETRDRLEALYQSSGAEEMKTVPTTEQDAVDVGFSEEEGELDTDPASKPLEDPEPLDDWTKQRISKAISSRARVQSQEELAKPKSKPPIDENPIFNKYKEGTLVTEAERIAYVEDLPALPSREHCTGFWRVISSPTGFDVEESDSARSDNLVCRVDGTIAGGPILDQETRQKASGGTWRVTGDTWDSAELRIRLVIPPTKNRILVMEGKLKKVSLTSDLPMASSTFGIPELEEKKAQAAEEVEDLLFCGGSVWIEDAVTGNNREEIGKFSLQKLHTPTDPTQYTITVPKPVRNQD
jgi:hypothetical protein